MTVTAIRHQIKHSLHLTEAEYVLCALLEETREGEWCTLSLEEICQRLFWLNDRGQPNVMTVSKMLARLENRGLVEQGSHRERRVTDQWTQAHYQ